ncbi:MAG: hypothetical protein ACI4CT_05510 [Lachnospiraceae bacterium]
MVEGEDDIKTKTIFDDRVIKSLLSFLKDSYKEPKETLRKVASNNNFIISGFSSGLLLIGILLFHFVFLLRFQAMASDFLGKLDIWFGITDELFSLPKALVTSILMWGLINGGVIASMYVLLRINKIETEMKTLWLESSVYTVITAMLLFGSTLFTFLHPLLGLALAIVAFLYLLIGCLFTNLEKFSDINTRKLIYTTVAIISILVLVLIFAFVKTFVWNINILA